MSARDGSADDAIVGDCLPDSALSLLKEVKVNALTRGGGRWVCLCDGECRLCGGGAE